MSPWLPRSKRQDTRQALVSAVNRLSDRQEYEKITVADIAAQPRCGQTASPKGQHRTLVAGALRPDIPLRGTMPRSKSGEPVKELEELRTLSDLTATRAG